jgi:hypothetical protein
VAFAWAALPEWVAWVLGGVFYFSSLFMARHMGFPLAAAFLLAHFLGQSPIVALGLGALFFIILGLKELVFIDRRLASTIMVFGLLIMAGFLLYGGEDPWSPWLPLKALIFAGIFWTLSKRFLLIVEEPNPKHPLALGAMSFILWEVALVVGFLPLDFLYQSSIAIFSALILFEWFLAYIEDRLTTNKILLYVSFLSILVTLIFTAANWAP